MDAFEFLTGRHADAESPTETRGTVDELRLMIREGLKSGVAAGLDLETARDELEAMLTSDHPFAEDRAWNQAREDATQVLRDEYQLDDADALIAEIADNLDKLPDSAGRSPYEYWVLGIKLQVIRATAARYGADIPLPVFDTMALGHMNALIRRTDDQYVLVFQSGIKSFSNLFARAVTRIWRDVGNAVHGDGPAESQEVIKELVASNSATDALQSILHGYLYLGHPGAAVQIPLEGEERRYAHRMEIGMDMFVVGHEFSHILHEHPADTATSTRDKEIEADRTGVFLMMSALIVQDNEDGVLPFCGAYAIVAMQETIMRTVAKINGVTFDRGQYPAAFERCVNMFASCERRGLLTPQIESTAMGFGAILGMICEHIEPQLLAPAADGRQLDAIWQPR